MSTTPRCVAAKASSAHATVAYVPQAGASLAHAPAHAGVRTLLQGKAAQVWEHAQTAAPLAARHVAQLDDIELLLHACEISCALDMYNCLSADAKAAVRAPVLDYAGRMQMSSVAGG